MKRKRPRATSFLFLFLDLCRGVDSRRQEQGLGLADLESEYPRKVHQRYAERHQRVVLFPRVHLLEVFSLEGEVRQGHVRDFVDGVGGGGPEPVTCKGQRPDENRMGHHGLRAPENFARGVVFR